MDMTRKDAKTRSSTAIKSGDRCRISVCRSKEPLRSTGLRPTEQLEAVTISLIVSILQRGPKLALASYQHVSWSDPREEIGKLHELGCTQTWWWHEGPSAVYDKAYKLESNVNKGAQDAGSRKEVTEWTQEPKTKLLRYSTIAGRA